MSVDRYCYLSFYNVSIPADKHGEALYIIDYLHSDEQLRQCADLQADGTYAYPNVENPDPGGFPSLEEALEAWNFYGSIEADGAMLVSAVIDPEQPIGALRLLIERLAPVLNPETNIMVPIETGSFIELCFWTIDDGKLREECDDIFDPEAYEF